MKARDLKMEEIIEFSPEEGKIFVKGTRVLIFNSDAMGILRKDLITNLGFERAKNFVIRWGYSCGYNDALSIKEQFDWDNDQEWISAGPVLHTLEGHTKVQVEEMRINREEKTWFLKGEFINSFEVEHYLRYFGKSESTVCWHLISYASGYATAFLGEPVYYKEITCIGKGDPHCTFYGKTLAEWGKEIESELPYYEENKISEELEAAHQRIQLQNRQLHRAFDIHKELTDLVLNGEGISGITNTLSRIINGTVYLLNPQMDFLATPYDQDDTFLKSLQNELLVFLKTILNDQDESINYSALMKQKRPISFKLKVMKQVFYCVLAPVTAGEDVLGYLTIAQIEPNIEFEQDLLITIERATNVYALEILKQKAVIDLEQQLRGDFLESLLSQTIYNESSLISWGLRLGHDITKPHKIITMDVEWIEQYKPKSEEKNILLKNELLKATSSYLKRNLPSVLCVNLRERIIVLLPCSLMEKTAIYQMSAKIKQINEKRFPGIILSFGIGNTAYKPIDYYSSYQQALEALQVIKGFGNKEHIRFFDDLGSFAVLLETQNKSGLKDYMVGKLGPLLEYDTNYHSELIHSLKQYLDTDSIRKAAVKSSVSVSGFKYRLNKIRELGYDLQSPKEKFDLQLALKIFEIM